VQAGDVVVLVDNMDGVEAGREDQIMSVRDSMLIVGCRSRDRLQLVLAHTWEVLPQELSAARGRRDSND
jgi:hypothetical protein